MEPLFSTISKLLYKNLAFDLWQKKTCQRLYQYDTILQKNQIVWFVKATDIIILLKDRILWNSDKSFLICRSQSFRFRLHSFKSPVESLMWKGTLI